MQFENPRKTRLLTRLCGVVDEFYLRVKKAPERLGIEKEKLKQAIFQIVKEEMGEEVSEHW